MFIIFANDGIKEGSFAATDVADEQNIKIININKGIKKDDKLILCVARIEGIKNQLNLIRALSGTNFHLLIIGSHSKNHKSYYEQCKAEAGSNIEFLPPTSRVWLNFMHVPKCMYYQVGLKPPV